MVAETNDANMASAHAAGHEQAGGRRLARWAMAAAVAALVLAAASPIWVPMLRSQPEPAAAAAAAVAHEAVRTARIAIDQTASLAGRIEALEATVQRLAAANAQATAAAPSGDIRRLALAGAIAQLRPAVTRPTPFAVELAVVTGLTNGEDQYAIALRLLARHAPTGIPTARQLRQRFPGHAHDALMAEAGTDPVPALMQMVTWMASTAPFGTGHLIHDLTMPDTAAALQEADRRLAADDLAGAVAVLGGLSGAAAAAMAPWTQAARARLDATRAIDILVRTALAELPASVR